jgi:hypothetical protein
MAEEKANIAMVYATLMTITTSILLEIVIFRLNYNIFDLTSFSRFDFIINFIMPLFLIGIAAGYWLPYKASAFFAKIAILPKSKKYIGAIDGIIIYTTTQLLAIYFSFATTIIYMYLTGGFPNIFWGEGVA